MWSIHYNTCMRLGLFSVEKSDLVQCLLSLTSGRPRRRQRQSGETAKRGGNMKMLFSFGFLFVIAVAALFAADRTWTGSISDSMCGATHKSAAEHGGKQMSARDCTLACVQNGGKYVFVRSAE